MLHVECLKCQTTQDVDDALAGTVVPCLRCGELLEVPTDTSGIARVGAADGADRADPLPAALFTDEQSPQRVLAPASSDSSAPLPLDAREERDTARDAKVLAEVQRLQNQRPGWAGAIGVLVISLLLFTGAARGDRPWDGLVILIPVLALHELGHYFAMRYFGYRNVRMFFIPFFGAAVSGRHYNVAGWKKAVVALAGPLPGIMLGAPLAIVGLALEQPKLVEVALMLLILNGFNLLPFLPLDGGWVVHAVLFVRHPGLDAVFRLVAGLCLAGVAILARDWVLIGLSIFMLLAIPMVWRRARVAHRLRKRGVAALAADADSIPADVATTILAELRPELPPKADVKVLAQSVVSVFEMLNAHPPGVLVSLGLLAVYAGSFLVALVVSVVVTVLRHGPT